MYDIIERILGHEWISNYSGDQQYIYFISGAVIVIVLAIVVDLIYRVFRHFWR